MKIDNLKNALSIVSKLSVLFFKAVFKLAKLFVNQSPKARNVN
jgi:hypothetical protein